MSVKVSKKSNEHTCHVAKKPKVKGWFEFGPVRDFTKSPVYCKFCWFEKNSYAEETIKY